MVKPQIRVENGKEKTTRSLIPPRQGKKGRHTSQPTRDSAKDEKAFLTHSNDRREGSWARGDEYMVLSFSLGLWCCFPLEPCSSANFHSA